MNKSPLSGFLTGLANLQLRRPWLVVLLTLASLVPATWAASGLTLKTSFKELLPDTKPSVIESRRLSERLAGNSTLSVVAEGKNLETLKTFIDEMSPRLMAFGPEFVGSVADGSREARKFFELNKHLYADLKDIEQIHEDVLDRYDYEVGKASGLGLELEDDEVPPEISADSLKARFSKKVDEAKSSSPGMDGYYIGEEGKLAALLVRTPYGSGSAKAFALQDKIRALVSQLKTEGKIDTDIRLGFTGNLITSAEGQRTIVTDLIHVGAWGIGMVLLVVFLFFLRVRMLFAMGATIFVGCLWAFAAARFTVGHLNTATGFLVSIIAGNGINFGIIYMARYIEARRDEGVDVTEAIHRSHRDTYIATLAAAAAASIAYGSLSVTDFRGFKHFGLIGGVGMVVCWIATYWLLPAVLVLSERASPMFGGDDQKQSWAVRMQGAYGRPFVWLAKKSPRGIAVFGLVSGLLAVGLSVKYFVDDPMEYNMRKIANKSTSPTEAKLLGRRVDKIVGRAGQDGRAIVVDRVDQVKPLLAELEKRRLAAPDDKKPFEKVVSVFEMLPTEQEQKLELLREIKDRISRARKRKFITDADWEALKEHIPDELVTIGIDDLPDLVVRPFQEKDGHKGRIVFIVPKEGRSVYDAHYLRIWADSFREVTLPNGDVIHGSGDAVIFSDMLVAVGEDAPRAIGLSLLGTFLVIVIAFRGRKSAWISLAILGLGIAWLVAFLAIRDIHLNFLNFVALPISIGVGSDYVLNVMKRREIAGDDLERVFIETGGAVVLCSLTTTVGYMALLLSINGAVESFGLAAAAGEVTTLLAAMLILPAFLFSQARKRAAAATE